MKPRALLALLLLGASAFFAWQAYQARERLAWRLTAGSINEVWTQTIMAPRSRFDGSAQTNRRARAGRQRAHRH